MTTEALRSPAEVIAESLNGLMNDPATVYAHIIKHWQVEDAKNLCNRLLLMDVDSLQKGFHRAQQDANELADKCRKLDGEVILSKNTIIDLKAMLADAEKIAQTKTQAVKSLSGVNLSLRQTVDELTAKLEHRNIPEGVRDLADYLSSIVPDRKCTIAGCWGKRGYSGYAITTDAEGKRKVVVNLCCGKVGQSEYTRIFQALRELNERQAQTANLVNSTHTFLFAWNIWRYWMIAKDWMKRKLKGTKGGVNAKAIDASAEKKPETAEKDQGRKEVKPLSLAVGGRKEL